jgi:hypothetical protein
VAGFGKGFLVSEAIRGECPAKYFGGPRGSRRHHPGAELQNTCFAISHAGGRIDRKRRKHHRPAKLRASSLYLQQQGLPGHPQRGFALSLGSLTGTCGEELTTRGLPSAAWAWLRSISSTNMNFSASIGIVHFRLN